MIRIATGTQMREIDRITIEEWGIPGQELMENAGRALTAEIISEIEDTDAKEVVILCGGGNNGGDGYVAARLLMEKNIFSNVYSTIDPEKLTGDACLNYERYLKLGGKVVVIKNQYQLDLLENHLSSADVILDGILGTGISRDVQGLTKDVIERINGVGKKVISIDIPSGVGADDGKLYGCGVKAYKTVTFQRKKVGMLLEPGKTYSGEVKVVDIGIPEEICLQQASEFFQIDMEEAKRHIKRRPIDIHKGDAGKVLLIAGSKGMAGAAVLAATAAMRSGAGLVKVAAPWEVVQVLQCKIPEATCLILGQPGHTTIDLIMEEAKNFDAVAIGPGIGRSEENKNLVEHIVRNIGVPLVIDADGINVIAENPQILREAKVPVILTPHPGEMSRLTGKSTKEVNQDRIGIAKSVSSEYNVTLILKGADSLVAVPQGRVYINGTGNPGMATGGSGDVLTGIIAAFLASGKDSETASFMGAYIHGMAGDIKAKTIGEYGMLASDIATAIALAICLITGERKEGNPMGISAN